MCIAFTKILPKENSLPHTVAEWYICHVHKNLLKKIVCFTLLLNGMYVLFMIISRKKKNGLLHTVAEWYISLVYNNLLTENCLLHTIAEWYICRVHEDLLIKNGLLRTVDHVPDMWQLNMTLKKERARNSVRKVRDRGNERVMKSRRNT